MKFESITSEEKKKLVIVAYLACFLANRKVKQDHFLKSCAINIVGQLRNAYANTLLSEIFSDKSLLMKNSRNNYMYCKATLNSTQQVCIAHLQPSVRHPRIASFRTEPLFLFSEMEDSYKQTTLNLNFTTSGKLLSSFPHTIWLEEPHTGAELQLEIPSNIEVLAFSTLADIETGKLDAKAFSSDYTGIFDIRDGQHVEQAFKFLPKQKRKTVVNRT